MTAITIDRSVLVQALEALDAIREADMAGATPKMVMKARSMYEPTITSLRTALAQEKAEPVVGWMDPESEDVVSAAQRAVWAQDFGVAGRRKAGRFTIPLRACLAQEQAEPTRSLSSAGFKPRDTRLECDECGGAFTRQMLPIHKCEPVQEQAELVVAERERWAILLRAAGRVLQAFDDGYLQLDPETLQGGIAVDALREAWGAFAPARIQGGQR